MTTPLTISDVVEKYPGFGGWYFVKLPKNIMNNLK
jgi:hypothetical protein